MNKSRIFLAVCIISGVIFSSCSKKSEDRKDTELTVNTWTFTQGSTVYKGEMLFETASFLKTPSSGDTYRFSVLGVEESTGYVFNVLLDLLDTTFTVKNYTSGVQGEDNWNSFYYTQSLGSLENIFESTNLDPGAQMNYTINSYDAAKSTVTINFNGEATDANGNKVNITNGKFTTALDK